MNPLNVYSTTVVEAHTNRWQDNFRDKYARLLTVIKAWYRRWSTRRHLRDLEEFRLADVGISAMERDVEVKKPFWVS